MSPAKDDEEVKKTLISNVKREVKKIMEEAVTRKFVHEESSSITSLCGAVEACLSHGLRRRALGLFKSGSTTALLHKVSKNFEPAAAVARALQELESDTGRRSSSSGDSTSRPLKPPLQKRASSNATGSGGAGGGADAEMRDFLAAFGLVSQGDAGRARGRGRTQHARAMETGKEQQQESSRDAHALDFPTDMLTAEQLGVLRNLGLVREGQDGKRRNARTMTADQEAMEDQEAAEAAAGAARASKEHVFNPSQHLAALKPTPDEVRRLNKLLDTFKKYTKENGSVSEEDVDILTPAPETSVDSDFETDSESGTDDPMIAEESESTTVFPDESEDSAVTDSPEELTPVNESEDPVTTTPAPSVAFVPLDKVPDAPSPLDIVELLQLFNATKNEVKRQQEANATASSTATATSTASSSSSAATSDSAASSSSTTKDDEDRGASADDLADSFGGAVDEDPATTPAPSGLYFLLDWNSFLEVGDPESERRVNIRIAPKVGDARRFLPVTVP